MVVKGPFPTTALLSFVLLVACADSNNPRHNTDQPDLSHSVGVDTPSSIGFATAQHTPCLEMSPQDAIHFGSGQIGLVSLMTVTVTNCAETGDLQVEAVDFMQDRLGTFFLVSPSVPVVLTPGQSLQLDVGFSPRGNAHYTGTMFVSFGEVHYLSLSLEGYGVYGECSIAVARARIQGRPDPFSNAISAHPHDTIAFDGSDSYPPPVHYLWSLIEHPTSSQARLMPDEEAANPTLFLDKAGLYEVQMTFFDENYIPACEPSRVTIWAYPQENLYVELEWDTQEAPMELHVLQDPDGQWNQPPYDCHRSNPSPNWHDLDSRDDDPIWDSHRFGELNTQRVRLNAPDGTTYRVGVYRPDDSFNSKATLRIYTLSVLVFEYRHKFLAPGDFWEVARIDWAQLPSIEQSDHITQGFP